MNNIQIFLLLINLFRNKCWFEESEAFHNTGLVLSMSLFLIFHEEFPILKFKALLSRSGEPEQKWGQRDSEKFLQGEKVSQGLRGGALSSRQRLKFTLQRKTSGRMDCVGYSLGINVSEAYPLVLIKKEYLNQNISKQGKHYGKIINRNSPVKIDKNYKEKHEIGSEINYYHMFSAASDCILTHKSRPVKVWNQMEELWYLFNVHCYCKIDKHIQTHSYEIFDFLYMYKKWLF